MHDGDGGGGASTAKRNSTQCLLMTIYPIIIAILICLASLQYPLNSSLLDKKQTISLSPQTIDWSCVQPHFPYLLRFHPCLIHQQPLLLRILINNHLPPSALNGIKHRWRDLLTIHKLLVFGMAHSTHLR